MCLFEGQGEEEINFWVEGSLNFTKPLWLCLLMRSCTVSPSPYLYAWRGCWPLRKRVAIAALPTAALRTPMTREDWTRPFLYLIINLARCKAIGWEATNGNPRRLWRPSLRKIRVPSLSGIKYLCHCGSKCCVFHQYCALPIDFTIKAFLLKMSILSARHGTVPPRQLHLFSRCE